ncbi:uncharacterized protein P174DRAFT_503127 [Aspergillus novofumigatus IBT 16806]|uniref:Uncharacterized protein n=1 Tax=Aspergillus novofumigatus (strain IBT 16806) TaxID=1392255 RepID=A0A2I1CDZ8_ASPN1|nr:uncharacterized protein P174DRAFT_503127 [Aspergillus novofumigatus IBT 16806]PKX95854.1 hypothetical protein P174DRAFT_503127 [Aspergillus novofumigatus IBT 16806]
MAWASAVATLLYSIIYPLTFLAYCVYGLLNLLVTPLWKLGLGVLNLALLPLRILAKFEAVLLFFATALIIGLILGTVVHLTSAFVIETLNESLGFSENPPSREDSKTRSRRSADVVRKLPFAGRPRSSRDILVEWPDTREVKPLGDTGGLLSSSILEEEEFSHDSA